MRRTILMCVRDLARTSSLLFSILMCGEDVFRDSGISFKREKDCCPSSFVSSSIGIFFLVNYFFVRSRSRRNKGSSSSVKDQSVGGNVNFALDAAEEGRAGGVGAGASRGALKRGLFAKKLRVRMQH